MGLRKLLYLEYQSRKLRRSVVSTGLRAAQDNQINVQVGGSGTLSNNISDIYSRVYVPDTGLEFDCSKLGDLCNDVDPELVKKFSLYSRLLSWEKIRSSANLPVVVENMVNCVERVENVFSQLTSYLGVNTLPS
jgi:hypothetical protein